MIIPLLRKPGPEDKTIGQEGDFFFLPTHQKIVLPAFIFLGVSLFWVSAAEGNSLHHYVIRDKRTEGEKEPQKKLF